MDCPCTDPVPVGYLSISTGMLSAAQCPVLHLKPYLEFSGTPRYLVLVRRPPLARNNPLYSNTYSRAVPYSEYADRSKRSGLQQYQNSPRLISPLGSSHLKISAQTTAVRFLRVLVDNIKYYECNEYIHPKENTSHWKY